MCIPPQRAWHMKVSHVGPAIISVALLSCTTPTENELPSVEFWTDRTAYVVGDSAVLTLTNRSANSILYYLLCTLGIQHMVGTSWEPVDTSKVVGCIESDSRELARFESEEWRFQVPTSAGKYRFRVTGFRPKGQPSFVISSDPFTVEN